MKKQRSASELIAVMLDFVNPAGAGRRGLRGRGQARLDNSQPRAGTLTQQTHSGLIKNLTQRVEYLTAIRLASVAAIRPTDAALNSPTRSAAVICPVISVVPVSRPANLPLIRGTITALYRPARRAPIPRGILGKSGRAGQNNHRCGKHGCQKAFWYSPHIDGLPR
jgi:hypothetical protein